MIATIATSNHPCAGPIRLRYRRTMAPTSADGTSPRLRTNASDVARTSTVTMPATAASTTRAVVMVDHTGNVGHRVVPPAVEEHPGQRAGTAEQQVDRDHGAGRHDLAA